MNFRSHLTDIIVTAPISEATSNVERAEEGIVKVKVKERAAEVNGEEVGIIEACTVEVAHITVRK